MTTPAACVPAWRLVPSSFMATSNHQRVSTRRVRTLCEIGGIAHRVFKRDAKPGRHQLGDQIDPIERDSEHAADILQGSFRRHRAESGNLGDAVGAILLLDIFDHFFAADLAEVDIDIRASPRLGSRNRSNRRSNSSGHVLILRT